VHGQQTLTVSKYNTILAKREGSALVNQAVGFLALHRQLAQWDIASDVWTCPEGLRADASATQQYG
jgi:hypothetical protein